MKTTDTSRAIYCTRTKRIIDTELPGGPTAENQLARHMPRYGPDLIILPFDEAYARLENAACSEPVEITAEVWHDALNVLPPAGWHNTSLGESFKVPEPLVSTIVSIYVRIGPRHFTFDDRIHTPHDECCLRVARSQAYAQMPAGSLSEGLSNPGGSDPAKPLPEPAETLWERGWPSSARD